MKNRFSSLFTIGIFLMYICTLNFSNFTGLRDKFITAKVNNTKDNIINYQKTFTAFESDLSSDLNEKYEYISINGAFARLLGEKELNSRVRINDLLYEFKNINEASIEKSVDSLLKFNTYLEEKDIPILYVQPPSNISPSGDELEPWMTNNENINATYFLDLLSETSVNTIDLRENMLEEGKNFQDAYLNTDHHWKIETAFWSSGHVMSRLSEILEFELNYEYLDEDNWNKKIHENATLGSSGRRVGPFFVPLDDFTVMTPKFDTDFTTFNYGSDSEVTGTYNVLINRQMLNVTSLDDYFETYFFGVYDSGYDSIINNYSYNDKVILILKDSFGASLTKMLAPHLGEIYTFDLRYKTTNELYERIEAVEPDLILFQYEPSAVTDINTKFALVK